MGNWVPANENHCIRRVGKKLLLLGEMKKHRGGQSEKHPSDGGGGGAYDGKTLLEGVHVLEGGETGGRLLGLTFWLGDGVVSAPTVFRVGSGKNLWQF